MKEIDIEVQNRFEHWWEEEASAMKPKENEDIEEFMYRLLKVAWMNGSYVGQVELMKEKR